MGDIAQDGADERRTSRLAMKPGVRWASGTLPAEPAGEAAEPAGEAPERGADRMREAAAVAALQAEETGGLGRLGRPIDKRSPFFVGMAGAAALRLLLHEVTFRRLDRS